MMSAQHNPPTSLIAISVKLNLIHSPEVIQFLVQNQIPFELQYDSPSKIIPPNALPKHQESVPDISTSDCIDEVYRAYIIDGIGQRPPLMSKIVAEMGLSMSKFKTQFKERYGDTFYQLYLNKRMEYAAELLKQGHKANEVSLKLGYGEHSAIKFNKMFQKHFGITPKKYQMMPTQRL